MSAARMALNLAAVLLASAALASNVSACDFGRYRPRTIQSVIKDLPVQAGIQVNTDLPIRSRVTYAGEFRDLPSDSRQLIAAWAQAMNVPVAPDAFRREAKIQEAGSEYWVPVQEVLEPDLRRERRPGEEIDLFMIYIGQINGRHLFLVNAFDHEGPH